MIINKNKIQSIISKYYLNGIVESVCWSVNKDKQLTIKFMHPSGEMIGGVIYNDFYNEAIDIGISNTSQLNKLLQVTNDDLELDFVKQNKVYTKLNIKDSQFNLSYVLADLMIIPKVASVGEIDFNIVANINQENINALIKAKNALPDSENVLITHDSLDGNKIKLEFGGDIEYANKISYNINLTEDSDTEFNLDSLYNSGIIKEILSNNKDMGEGIIYLNNEGIMKIEFHKENITSFYYLVAREK